MYKSLFFLLALSLTGASAFAAPALHDLNSNDNGQNEFRNSYFYHYDDDNNNYWDRAEWDNAKGTGL